MAPSGPIAVRRQWDADEERLTGRAWGCQHSALARPWHRRHLRRWSGQVTTTGPAMSLSPWSSSRIRDGQDCVHVPVVWPQGRRWWWSDKARMPRPSILHAPWWASPPTAEQQDRWWRSGWRRDGPGKRAAAAAGLGATFNLGGRTVSVLLALTRPLPCRSFLILFASGKFCDPAFSYAGFVFSIHVPLLISKLDAHIAETHTDQIFVRGCVDQINLAREKTYKINPRVYCTFEHNFEENKFL